MFDSPLDCSGGLEAQSHAEKMRHRAVGAIRYEWSPMVMLARSATQNTGLPGWWGSPLRSVPNKPITRPSTV